MTAALNEDLVEAIDAIGKTIWSGQTFRYTNARREPLSGEGARRAGGRYNPRELFPTVYLAQPAQACMRELERAAATQHLDVERFLGVPQVLHTIELSQIEVLDLTCSATRDRLGLTRDRLGLTRDRLGLEASDLLSERTAHAKK